LLTRRIVLVLLGLWLAAAVNVGATGALRRLPVPPPAIAIGLTILLLALLRMSRRVRAAGSSFGPQPLVAFHTVRVVAGAYFLVLYRRGVLPGEFAVPAGWGDIVVGIAAMLVAQLCLPAVTPQRRRLLLLWNVAGLIDILAVLANGMRIFLANPAIGAAFTSLPLALLPTFVVPLVIVSHVLIFGWTRPAPR
jgi:hypothetical protein